MDINKPKICIICKRIVPNLNSELVPLYSFRFLSDIHTLVCLFAAGVVICLKLIMCVICCKIEIAISTTVSESVLLKYKLG